MTFIKTSIAVLAFAACHKPSQGVQPQWEQHKLIEGAHKRQQCNGSGPFDGRSQRTLMGGACACNSSWDDFPTLGDKVA
jgi:hypothetical protein